MRRTREPELKSYFRAIRKTGGSLVPGALRLRRPPRPFRRCIPGAPEALYRHEQDVVRARICREFCRSARTPDVECVAAAGVGWLRDLQGGLEQPHWHLHLRPGRFRTRAAGQSREIDRWHDGRRVADERRLARARSRETSGCRARVDRTLPLLTESGLVREMDFGKDYKFYDPNYAEHPNHSHIICQDCDKIVEFDSEKIERLESEISHKLGFEVKSQRLQITGRCQELKKLGACRKKSC